MFSCTVAVTVKKPTSCVVDNSGNVIVGQTVNLFELSNDYSSATSIAGDYSESSNVDGDSSTARFGSINQIVIGDAAQTFLFVCDFDNDAIRKVEIASGTTSSPFSIAGPIGIAISPTYNVIFVSSSKACIFYIIVSNGEYREYAGISGTPGENVNYNQCNNSNYIV